MSESATNSKFSSPADFVNAGARLFLKRSENPMMPTPTRSFAPAIFAELDAAALSAVPATPAPASFKKLRRDAPPLAIETPPSFVQYAPPSFILDALLSDRMPQVLRQVRYCGLMSMMKRGTCGKVRRQVPFAVMR